MKKIIDLFAGVGGLSLGAFHAGLEVIGAVEIDKIAIDTHILNFPSVKHLNTDISELTGEELEEHFGESDLFGLVGGPPCQGFSTIGKQQINDPRNQLFIHFFRLVKETQPVFFLAENVTGILHPKFDEIVKKAHEQVVSDYDLIEPVELNAKKFGVPTSRSRVFFIGIRKDHKHSLTKEKLLALKREMVTVSEAFEGLEHNDLFLGNSRNSSQHWTKMDHLGKNRYAGKISSLSKNVTGNEESKRRYFVNCEVSGMIGTNHTQEVIRRFEKLLPGETDKISRSTKLKANGLCPTLRAGTSSERGSFQAVRPIHPFYNRVITPREAARIQGFPDWFLFHSTKWHSFKQIGNSVSPIMAMEIFKTIIMNLEEL